MITIIDHGRVRELRLNRPPANALTSELFSELCQQVDSAPSQNISALVLSGAPGMFSAGLDIPHLLQLDRPQIATLWKQLYAGFGSLACSRIPICAAITGHAPAGGAVLGVFCDWRIAADGPFKIGLSEVQVGLPLPPVILRALRRLLGAHKAERLAVTGALMTPQEAALIGLVDEVVPPEQVVGRAIAWADAILALPQGAMSYTRRQSRADLVGLFEPDLTSEIEEMREAWWKAETQTTLKSVAERLTKKQS
ncbi:MAG TPA: enoyl-CoA hydratase/isomerase family protein [Terriglobales bacterium]|nr:enoyl-CoA hydratase/isomerase family protein [Terriglobales bacterium]